MKKGRQNLEKEKVVGYILSFFFGYVFTVYLDNYENLSSYVNLLQNNSWSILVTHIAIIIFGVNIFRMLHGYIILLHDNESPVYGKVINSFFQLILLVLTFILPLFSLLELSKITIAGNQTTSVLGLFNAPTLQFVFILFSLPQLYYFVWDSILYFKNGEEKDEYQEYSRVWLLLDAVILISMIYAIFLVNLQNYYAILLVYSIICLGIIIGDYLTNKTYYFNKV